MKDKLTNEEKVKILEKYFGDVKGNINLNDIDLGNKCLYIERIKVKNLSATCLEAKNKIINAYQQAPEIINAYQKATKNINNTDQEVKIVWKW